MILVDSSVWIDLLNNVVTEPVRRLRELIPTTPLLVGDLILCEVLQGFRTDAQARLVERSLMRFEAVSLIDPELGGQSGCELSLPAPPRDHDPKDDRPPYRHILYRTQSHPVAQRP